MYILLFSKRYRWDDITWLTSYDGDMNMTFLLLYFASNSLEFSKLSPTVVMNVVSSTAPGTKQALNIFLLKE